MRITLLLTMFVLAAPAMGQEPAATAPPPAADAAVLPTPNGAQPPAAADPVGRLENRLDQIERRLDQQGNPNAAIEPQGAGDPVTTDAANSRYRYQDGVWWYWLPSNRWVYYSNGAWVDFVPTTQPSTVVYRSVAPAYSYVPSYGYGYPRSYSSYGYYPSYGGYYGSGWGSAVGLGLAIGYGSSHGHYNHGHFHGGHGNFHGGHGHFHGGHGGHHGGHGGHHHH